LSGYFYIGNIEIPLKVEVKYVDFSIPPREIITEVTIKVSFVHTIIFFNVPYFT